MGTETLDNKKFVVDSLLATKRDGIEDLIEYMEEIGFFHAPCSGGNHYSCEFGLVHHTRHVMELAEKIGVCLLGGAKYNEIHDSVIIAAALHDLGKCGDFGKPMYTENILKNGKRSDAKPYERNKELTPVPHGMRSVKLATLFIDLTEEEEWAIMCHDGLYEPSTARFLPGHETPLNLIIHWADMWACHVVDTKVIESEDK